MRGSAQPLPDVAVRGEQERERPLRQPAFLHRLLHAVRRARRCRDGRNAPWRPRAAGGEGGSRVATRDREGEREVRGAEHSVTGRRRSDAGVGRGGQRLAPGLRGSTAGPGRRRCGPPRRNPQLADGAGRARLRGGRGAGRSRPCSARSSRRRDRGGWGNGLEVNAARFRGTSRGGVEGRVGERAGPLDILQRREAKAGSGRCRWRPRRRGRSSPSPADLGAPDQAALPMFMSSLRFDRSSWCRWKAPPQRVERDPVRPGTGMVQAFRGVGRRISVVRDLRRRPPAQAGGSSDAGIEGVGRIEATIEIPQRRLGLVEVADIVLGRIFRAARVEQGAERVFQRLAVLAFVDEVFLVHDVAQEVPT